MVDLKNGSFRLTSQAGSHFELSNEEHRGLFTLHDGRDELLSVAQTTGSMRLRGDLLLGGAGTTGSRGLSIQSVDGGANLLVEALSP